jgi:DNA-binding transcriptional MerR regulator
MATPSAPQLTIGEAAGYAGVTVRAVRHYHQRGLLPEPPRDASGYRRYGTQDIIDLIRIKALSQAGVPLARVGELLHADPGEFAVAVAEIDVKLQEEIRRLETHRLAVAQLASGDGLALPVEVVDYLDLLRGLGLSERIVTIERDGWLLVTAQVPDQVREWIAGKVEAMHDPMFIRMYRAVDEAIDCQPDDPRLEQIADDLASLFGQYSGGETDADAPLDDTLVAMLDAQTIGSSAGWRHLALLLEQRGWTGWTNPESTGTNASEHRAPG